MASGDFAIPKFHFNVTIDGKLISFQEVTGLTQENEFLEYRHGDDLEFVTQKRVGMKKTGTVSFKKGIFSGTTNVLDLYEKVNAIESYFANQDPIEILVSLMDESGESVVEWNIVGAVPVKMDNGDLKSEENALAFEQIDFVHSGIRQTHN